MMLATSTTALRAVSEPAESKGVAPNDNRASDVLLNQYYTRDFVAVRLYALFRRHFDPSKFLMFEPSAGTGSFSTLLPPGSRAVDIDPRCSGIETADFLNIQIGGDRPIAVIGNPPFSGGLARKFFDHAASQEQVQVIAFIVPRSFRKASILNKLDRNFHLLHEEDVENDAFLFRSKPFHVPAVFQIWVRRGVKRDLLVAPTTHADFNLLGTSDGADFALQRVGARAGRVHRELWRSGKAHYFVRANHPGVEAVMRQLDFDDVKRDVAGKPSIAKTELVSLYTVGAGIRQVRLMSVPPPGRRTRSAFQDPA